MGKQYIYPADLKSEPKLWLWNLKDLAALGNILAELGSILIIDLIVFSAENADFSFSMEAASLLERSIFSLKCHGLPPMY